MHYNLFIVFSCRSVCPQASMHAWLLQVESELDFLADLPNLRSVMMGKQYGSWSLRTMLHMTNFSARLKDLHPGKTILRISCPGHTAAPYEEEQS